MKLLFVVFFSFVGLTVCNAQTSKELIGKWKLVKKTINGKVDTPKDTYQVFKENGVFVGINGNESTEGKWQLSGDNSKLTVQISSFSVIFDINYFDANKRTITSPITGTLEYVKAKE